jgi:hypothetical protein
MNKPLAIENPLDLTVRFIGGAPIDEVVYWVKACAKSHAASGPLTVVLEKKQGAHAKKRVYEVRLERPDRVLLTEQDPNVMLAVRNAFDRLALTPERIARPRASA